MISLLFYRLRKLSIQTIVPKHTSEISLLHVVLLSLMAGVSIGLLVSISPWLALAVTLVFVVGVVAVVSPVWLCYLTIIGVAFTSGMERGRPVPFLRVNEIILLFSTVIAIVIVLTRKKRQRINIGLFGIAIIILILGITIIPGAFYLLRGTKLVFADAVILLAPLQYVVLFWLFSYLPENNLERRKIVKLMILCGSIVALIGILQAVEIEFVSKILEQWYSTPHQRVASYANRVTSLIGSWNGLGIFLMLNLIIIWGFGISRPHDFGWLTILATGFVCISCLLLSGSFAGIIGLIIGIAFVTFQFDSYLNRNNIFLFLGIIGVIAVTSVVFRERISGRLDEQFGYGGIIPTTLLERFRLWQEVYFPEIQKNLLGINPSIPASFTWPYTESQYLDLLFSFGLVGFFAYLLWVFLILISLRNRLDHQYGFLRTLNGVTMVIISVLFIAGFTNAVFSYSGTADYLWILLALITVEDDNQSAPEYSN